MLAYLVKTLLKQLRQVYSSCLNLINCFSHKAHKIEAKPQDLEQYKIIYLSKYDDYHEFFSLIKELYLLGHFTNAPEFYLSTQEQKKLVKTKIIANFYGRSNNNDETNNLITKYLTKNQQISIINLKQEMLNNLPEIEQEDDRIKYITYMVGKLFTILDPETNKKYLSLPNPIITIKQSNLNHNTIENTKINHSNNTTNQSNTNNKQLSYSPRKKN